MSDVLWFRSDDCVSTTRTYHNNHPVVRTIPYKRIYIARNDYYISQTSGKNNAATWHIQMTIWLPFAKGKESWIPIHNPPENPDRHIELSREVEGPKT